MRGTIDGIEVYMDEDQLPAITMSVNSLADPSKITGATSSTIRVIATKEARRVLGREGMNEVGRLTRARLRIADDSCDLFAAELIPVRHDRDVIECIAVGGNASWFDWAKGARLTELDLGESKQDTDDAYVISTWTDTTGLLYFPIIDFGYIQDRSSSFGIQMWHLRPCLRLSALLKRAFSDAGYLLTARGLLANYFDDFILSNGGEAFTAHRYGHPEGATVRPNASSTYTLTDIGAAPNVYDLQSVVLDPASHMSSSQYVASSDVRMTVRVDGIGVLIDPFAPPPDGEMFYLSVYDSTNGVLLASMAKPYDSADNPDGVRFYGDTAEFDVPSGANIRIGIQRDPGGYGTINDGYYGIGFVTFMPVDPLFTPQVFRWDATDFTTYTLDGTGMTIDLDTVAPNMTVAELLSAFMLNQGLIAVTTIYNTVELWREDDYFRQYNGTSAYRDWSDRVDHTIAPARLTVPMPWRLEFRWKNDEGDDELVKKLAAQTDPKYANESVVITNGLNDPQNIELPFSQTVMGEAFGNITVPIIRSTGGTYQQDTYGRDPRLLLFGGMASGNWKLGSAAQTEYPFCYFVRSGDDGVPLAWANGETEYPGSVEANWHLRISKMHAAVLECYLFIRDHELTDFDFGMPTLVDDGTGPAWYWVQEIIEHRYGRHQPTKVRLVRIPIEANIEESAIVEPTYPSQP
jgi:hypothetical protein